VLSSNSRNSQRWIRVALFLHNYKAAGCRGAFGECSGSSILEGWVQLWAVEGRRNERVGELVRADFKKQD
jgi:hypothetical protein